MSKQNRVRAGGWLALAACVALSSAGAASAAQRAQRARKPAAAAAVNPKTAAVRAATAEVLQETSEIRKLRVLRPVKSGAQTREEIERMLIRNLDENSSPEELRVSELALERLGMFPEDFRLREFLIKLLTEQVAGYYEPKTRQFYLADWIDLDGQKPVMAHELTHALQDQHFNLRRFEKWPEHESDSELAAHALVEGDAMVLMTQYIMRSPMRQLAMLKSLVTGGAGSTAVFDAAPRVLRETLVFPYTQGGAWVGQVYNRGGWEAVSAAYSNLPKSTEQILHPEKYFEGEAPQKVALKDLSAALGKGWKLADHDVNGEWGYFLLVDEFLKAREVSQKASAGWGGDRYAVYTGPGPSDVLLTHKTVWDTPEDAREFFDAYAGRTTKRYGVEPEADGAAGRRVWKTPHGVVVMELNGSAVNIVEGAPDPAKAAELIRAL